MTSRSFVLALAFCAALPAAADRNFGVKAGVLNIDGDSAAATQAGIVYTADIWGMFGIEFDATTSIAKGEVTPLEYGVTQFGAYGVFMTPGPIYVKAKAGFAYTDLDFPGAATSSDPAYGVGFGFEFFGVAMEVEYAQFKADGNDGEMATLSIKF
jgi:hypothetical protein